MSHVKHRCIIFYYFGLKKIDGGKESVRLKPELSLPGLARNMIRHSKRCTADFFLFSSDSIRHSK